MIHFIICALAVPLAIGKGRSPILWLAFTYLTPWAFVVLVCNKTKPMKKLYLPESVLDRLTKREVDRQIAKLEQQFQK